MPELSQNFIKGRMNKDLDERLVANGEYRDALNIEVSTSEGANVGAVQTTMGNTKVGTGFGTCVASIADEKNDDIYWLVAGIKQVANNSTSENITKDAILKYHLDPSSNTYTTTPVLVDVHYRTHLISQDAHTSNQKHFHIGDLGNGSINITSVRKGMIVTGTFTNNTGGSVSVMGTSVANGATYTLSATDNVMVTKVQYYAPGDTYHVFCEAKVGQNTYLDFPSKTGDVIVFTSKEEDRVLNFDSSRLITGINIIDDLMFWTDNYSEPKKINLTKCIKGTLDIHTHSSFIVEDDDGQNYTVPSANIQNGPWGTSLSYQGWFPIRKEHITVVKRSPLIAPKLKMSDTEEERGTIYGDYVTRFTSATENLPLHTVNAPSMFNFTKSSFNVIPDWRIGDIVLATNDAQGILLFTDWQARLRVIDETNTEFKCQIIGITSIDLPLSNETWSFVLERKAPLFEFKFPRFSYRYKYQDGEYSSFAPFSTVAFMPGPFDYNPKKGFNLGMTNQLRHLQVKDFIIEDSIRPNGVIAVDILYKESNSPNIYTVKTITVTDDEWSVDGINPNAASVLTRGSIDITSELIYATLPSNQLLRPWDNVPRKALGQEISSNRLIYGNYVESFDLTANGIIIKPKTNINLESFIGSVNFNNPKPSIKSLRTYQVGVVYRDEFGRETPVLASKIGDTGTINIKKDVADKENILKINMQHDPPDFADTFKFFIKETSNEYYNLAMDRWYPAEDGSIWLSFPSSERNKVDEDTYLILKKQHDNNVFVEEEARYKILAISNEVPDHVKQSKKPYGTLGNNSDRSIFGYAGGGYPERDSNFVYIEKDTFNADSIAQAVDPGQADHMKFLRFKTLTKRSQWYEIAAIQKIELFNLGSKDTYKIELETPMGKDMDFTTQDSTNIGTGVWADRIGNGNSNNTETLTLEIAKHVEEIKPSHRGRFFVRIYQDGTLRKNILDTTPADRNWISVFSEPIYRLKGSDWTKPKDWGNGSSGVPETPNPDGWEASWWNAGGGNEKVEQWWRNFGSHWFIDELQTKTNDWSGGSADNSNMYGVSHPGNNAGGITDLPGANGTRKILHLGFGGVWAAGTKPKPQAAFGVDNHKRKQSPKLDVGGNANLDEKTWVDYITSVGTVFRWSKDPDGVLYVVEDARLHKSGSTLNDSKCSAYLKDELTNYDAYCQVLGGTGEYFHAANKRIRWEIKVGQWDGIGDKPGTTVNGTVIEGLGIGVLSTTCTTGYKPTNTGSWGGKANHYNTPHPIEIVQLDIEDDGDFTSTNPAIWETEPKEDIGLDLYYEASQANPINLDYRTNEIYIPINSYLVLPTDTGASSAIGSRSWTCPNITYYPGTSSSASLKVTAFNDDTITINDPATWTDTSGNTGTLVDGDKIVFKKPDGGMVEGMVKTYTASSNNQNATIKLYSDLHNRTYYLDWFNCYSFGNGVESNRIRDDFNQVTIDKGPKVSTTVAGQYKEERKKNGLIYSGIYNSTSGVNDLNQFIMAEKITKDLSPRFGSIQKLHARDTDLVTFCEDKVVRCLANKDAVYNADGNSQLIATNRVLGQTVPFAGEHGISTNPESFASQSFQAYFSDRVRGVVMRLSRDGLTPVSEHGMKDWFSDNLKEAGTIIGSYDDKKSLYNITLKDKVAKSVDVDTDTTPISFVNTNPVGWFIPTNNPPSAIASIKYTQVDDDDNYQTGGGTLDLVTQIVLPTTGYYEDRSTELQALAAAIDECPNGTVYLHYQALHGTLASEQSGVYTDSEVGVITYTINSYTFNDNGAYIFDVDYHAGAYFMLDSVYFWWSSEGCDEDDGGDDGDKGNFVERTLSFAEKTNGWVSFKSWIQESGLSLNGKFYTFSSGDLYEHEKNQLRNNFYGTQYTSTVDVLLNEQPGSVKSFQFLKYSGSQSRITKNTLTGTNSDGYNQFDNEYYNNIGKTGWYASSIETDLQSGKELEFRPKEGKWFTAMQGVSTYFNSATDNNIDEGEFSVQGIGYTASVHCPDCGGEDPREPVRDTFTLKVQDDPTDH